ncbi:MAG: hypothetical protein JSS51_04465 [Planctomycetes bacterium]|nr:hypothetical protein [Planctomycetota bacterium]
MRRTYLVPNERLTFLSEAAFDGSNVDHENGIIRGVKLLGEKAPSKGMNARGGRGRRYELDAMRSAAALYENVPVHLNHLGSEGRRATQDRGVEDVFGVVKSARFEESKRGIFGDIHFNKKHPRAEQIAYAAEKFPHTVGASHVADGAFVRTDTEEVIRKIVAVESVDLVRKPATTSGLYESEESGADPMTLEELRKNQPDLVKQLTESIRTELNETSEVESLKRQVKTLTEEKATLATENDKLKATVSLAERKQLVESKIAAAKLPPVLVTDTFRTQLVEAKDEKALDTLIAERVEIAKATKPSGGKPASTVQRVTESKGGDEAPVFKDLDTKGVAKAFGF